ILLLLYQSRIRTVSSWVALGRNAEAHPRRTPGPHVTNQRAHHVVVLVRQDGRVPRPGGGEVGRQSAAPEAAPGAEPHPARSGLMTANCQPQAIAAGSKPSATARARGGSI